jgi:hypothetical protein
MYIILVGKADGKSYLEDLNRDGRIYFKKRTLKRVYLFTSIEIGARGMFF